MMIDFTGTTSDRKISVSRMNEKPRTNANTSGV